MIVVLALRVDHPVKILVWFLAGGLLTTITIGIAVVFALQGTSFVSGSNSAADPTVYLTAGLLSLVAAYAVNRRTGKAETAPPAAAADEAKKPSAAQRAVERGAPVAFAAGVVLNIVPGTFPLVGMKDIAQLDSSNGLKVAAVVVFYVIMFAFVEVPIVAFLLAPERTTAAVDEFNAWLGRNGRRIAAYVLAAVGAYLIVRGLVALG